MRREPQYTWMFLAGVLVAIGCGSRPQDAAATSQEQGGAKPVQLAQATEGSGAAPAPAGSGTIRGTVKFSGAPPAASHIKMDADPQCQLQHKDPVSKQDMVVNPNGTLQHVFVYVKSGLEGKTFTPPADAVVLNQHGCMYQPHVMGIQVGQPLEIVNDDATLHNVNCKPANSKPFNIAQPVQGMKSKKQFTAPEIMVKCACNVHPWMAAYVGVLPHPYFSVSGEDGGFSLTGLPAGDYTVEAWHEKFGAQAKTVHVGDGETASVDFEFTG